ncbi:hypothetical protein JHK82_051337 [Glycine max]|nr:hypothetical protein JHK82_051337 [Glycine max]
MPCSAQSLEVQVQNRNKDIITEVEQGATSSCISLFNEKLEGLTKDITNSQGKPIVSATEKVIYNLESMEISLKEAEWLQKYIVSVHRMHKLQRLVLNGLENTEIPFCHKIHISSKFVNHEMLMHHGTESSTLGFVGKDYSDGSCCYSSLSSHPSGIVVVINSYGQPGQWFMLLAPLLVLDVLHKWARPKTQRRGASVKNGV